MPTEKGNAGRPRSNRWRHVGAFRPDHEKVDVGGKGGAKAESFVPIVGPGIVAFDMQAERAMARFAFGLQVFHQARTDALVARSGEQGDVHDPEFGGPAIDIEPADDLTVLQDEVKVGVGVVEGVALMLGVELLLDELLFFELAEGGMRQFLFARGAVQSA